MDPTKSERLHPLGGAYQFACGILSDSPSTKLRVLLEQQVPRTFSLLHRQRRQRLMFSMELHHTREINRAKDVDVVQKEWFFTIDRMLEKKIGCLFQAAARIQQDLLGRDHNIHTEILVAV